MYRTDFKNLEKESIIEPFRSSGPGGQRKNKKETAIRLYHMPSGLTVAASKHRSQEKNKEFALELLKKKLEILNRPQLPRIKTKIPYFAKQKRLKKKKLISAKKQSRKKPFED